VVGEFPVMVAAAPGVPVTVKVTGLPESVPEVAVSVFVPTAVPSVHAVTAAIPSTPVGTAVVGLTLPPPAVTAKVTATPDTGFPLASFTTTDGAGLAALPTVPDALGVVFAAIVAAAPALSVIEPETTAVSPVAPKLRV
jgi:hypothetical protein